MKEIEVDCDNLNSVANQISSCGENINTSISDMCEKINNLHNYWQGERYNSFVQDFNSVVIGLNNILEMYVQKLPNILKRVAYNYKQADKQNGMAPSRDSNIKIVAQITVNKDEKMKFITSKVSIIQSEISKSLSKVKDKINSISRLCKSVSWESDTSKTFKNQIKKVNNQAIFTIEMVQNKLDNAINQAKADVESAENASMT